MARTTFLFFLMAACVCAQQTPKAFFQTQLKRIAQRQEEYLEIKANVPEIASSIGQFIGKPLPTDAADLDHWAAPNAGPEIPDLPIVWDAAARKFVVREDGLRNTSDAVIYFTWNFLRAYDALSQSLRESGSAFAIGIASLVAAETTYRTNWAYLPVGLHDATAMANFLVLGDTNLAQRSLLPADTELTTAIAQALGRVCPVVARENIAAHLQNEALFVSGADERPGRLEQWREQCGGELPGDELAKIHNLTIRALAVERPAAGGEPDQCSGDSWGCHIKQLLDDLEGELKDEEEHRGVPGLAPLYNTALTKSDPTILVPLMVATSPFAFAKEFPRAKELMMHLTGDAGQDAVAEAELKKLILEELDSFPVTGRILSLAGRTPEFRVFRKTDDKVATVLIWRNMTRIEPANGDLRTEQVILELVSSVPGGKKPDAPSLAGGAGGGGGGGRSNTPSRQAPADPVMGDASASKKQGNEGGGGGGGGKGTGNGPEGVGQGGKGQGTGLEGLGNGQLGPGTVGPEGTALVAMRGKMPVPSVPGEQMPPFVAPITPTEEPKKIEPKGTDPIRISAAGRAELTARSEVLRTTFESERGALKLPMKSPLLAYLEWMDWRQRPEPPEWLPDKFDEFVKMRSVFLGAEGGPYASRLASILRRELYMASWLRETSATRTADLLILDMIELAVYAGTERGLAQERLWKLDLPLVLGFPALVHGEPIAAEGASIKLGPAARQAILDWSAGANLESPLIDGDLSLNELYTFWTNGEYGREPYLAKLSPLTDSGKQPEWARCDSGRLCRWYFLGEGLSHAPGGNPARSDAERRP